jgi:hypothetical protein
VANPDLHLTDQFTFHVIPGDTIKALTRYPSLIARRVYRPSLLSQMNQKRRQMTARQKEILYRLANDPSVIERDEYQALGASEKALLLDVYLDFAQYETMKKEKTAAVLDKATRPLLLERSKLDVRSDRPEKIAPLSTPPELGHGSAQIRFGVGGNEETLFEEISLRPAYHDLLANDVGYGKYSQILFLETTVRYYNKTKDTKLDTFKLIDIISLTPYDPLFKKKSWQLSIGIDTLKELDCGYCNAFRGDYGVGLSYLQPEGAPLLLYALLQFELDVSRRLEHHYRLGGGAMLGAIVDAGDHWRMRLAASYLNFPLGHDSDYYKVTVDQRYAIVRDLDLRLELSALSSSREWLASVNYYF